MKQRSFDLLAVSGVFLAYTATTGVALGQDLPQSLVGGVANTIPVVIFGIGVRSIVVRLIARPLPIQMVAHLLLCAAYCALTYCLLIILIGLFNGAGPDGFVFRPFSLSGTAWQSLENATTYALIAALSHLRAQSNVQLAVRLESAAGQGTKKPEISAVVNQSREEAAAVPASRAVHPAADLNIETQAEAGSDTGLSRYFVRIGEELRPLDIDMVVSINGADDYAEVSTTTAKHLVRMTLTSFSKSLDPSKYIRVHRSWIVNTHRVTRAEPAGGGRLLLHMETGQVVSTSRDGAKLFRNRVL
jgi:DNA-binding LytR/AlgR family response regulator